MQIILCIHCSLGKHTKVSLVVVKVFVKLDKVIEWHETESEMCRILKLFTASEEVVFHFMQIH